VQLRVRFTCHRSWSAIPSEVGKYTFRKTFGKHTFTASIASGNSFEEGRRVSLNLGDAPPDLMLTADQGIAPQFNYRIRLQKCCGVSVDVTCGFDCCILAADQGAESL
jgi:hypothetical protein